MKLISFGSTNEAQVVLHSPYVSGYHAELLLLDNGDMLLFDKGSKNGTFVNGMRIEPEKAVGVSRQSQVYLADQPLNWATVPVITPNPNVVETKSIGSHYMNTIRVNDPKVSRFHATVKKTNKGKWFICDHSSNGTTVNGARLPKDLDRPLKASDKIVCAGIPVQNPIPQGGGNGKIWGIIAGAAAAVAAVVALIFVLGGGTSAEKLYKKYANATVMVECDYHFRASAEHFEPMEFIIKDGDPVWYDGSECHTHAASGFFIGDDGVIATNLHVVAPWKFKEKEDALFTLIKSFYVEQFSGRSLSIADVKVDGIIDIGIYPNGLTIHPSNRIPCKVLIESDNMQRDIALLQTLDGKFPDNATSVPYSKIFKEKEDVAIGTEVALIGFPASYIMQDWSNVENIAEIPLQASSSTGIVSKNNDKDRYYFDAASYSGASGSPIFDLKKGRVVGIATGAKVDEDGSRIQGANFCIKSRHLYKLLQKASEE